MVIVGVSFFENFSKSGTSGQSMVTVISEDFRLKKKYFYYLDELKLRNLEYSSTNTTKMASTISRSR